MRATVYEDANKSNHVISLNCIVDQYNDYEAPIQSIEDDFLSPESQSIVNDLKNNSLLSTHLENHFRRSFPKQKIKFTKGIEESFYYY